MIGARVRGEGSIVQLEKDKTKGRCRKWQLRVSCGKDPMTGRYVTKTRRVTGTYTEATKQLRSFIVEIEGGVAGAKLGVTFADECERFLAARRASGNYSANRMAGLEAGLKAACMHLGHADFAEVTPRMIDQMVAAMRAGDSLSGKPLSGTYTKSVVKQVSLVYKQAIKEGRLARNPCDGCSVPKRDTAPREAMRESELKAFVAELDATDEHDFAWRLAATLGLRRGEICGLSWGDVDLDERTVTVAHSFDRAGNLKSPKTGAGRRTLPLTEENAAAFAAHWEAQISRGIRVRDKDPVVVTESGTRVAPDLLSKWWARDRKALGAEKFTIHELRHSYLTALARAGVHPKVMQELAGHANSQITMDIYTHVDMTGKRAAAEALQAYFEDNRGPQEQQQETPKPTAVPPATADAADETPMFTLVPVSAA